MFETPEEVVETPETKAAPEVEAEVEPEADVAPADAKPSRSQERKAQLEREIRELNERKNRLAASMVPTQPQPQPHSDWDTATVEGIRSAARTDPIVQQAMNRLQAADLKILEMELRADNPDWDDYQDEFGSLVRATMEDPKTRAQAIFDAVKARKGVYTAQGAKQAQEQQRQRAAATAPRGEAPSTKEKNPLEEIFSGSGDVRYKAQRDAYRMKVKRGQIDPPID